MKTKGVLEGSKEGGKLFARCPSHHGRNIAYRACQICGHVRAEPDECREMVTRWDERPGQLTLDAQAQLEIEI